VTGTTILAALGLACWLVFATLVVRRAEARVARTALPAPWPAVAISLALSSIALASRPLPAAVTGSVVCIALVAAAGADRRTGFLFDAITLPTAIVVGALAVGFGLAEPATLGVVVIVGLFGIVYLATRGTALGLGDVKALYGVGAALGPIGALVTVCVASFAGLGAAALGGSLRARQAVAFGPYLAVGAAFALLVADPLMRRYGIA